MAEHGISAETMLVALQDIRLPANAPGGVVAELLAVVGIGLALALVMTLCLQIVLRPRPAAEADPPIADRIAALRGLPDEDRALALLSLIRVARPRALQELRATLYARDSFPDVATLEAVLLSPESRDV